MRKKIVIIGILLMLFVFGVTYAWWSWNSSTNTDVTFNVEGASITYSAGNNISGIKLIPVSSKEKGVSDNTAAYKEITASSNKTMYLTLNLDLTTFPSNLADASLVWEIYKGNEKLGNGNFSGKQQGDSITLFSSKEINSTESLYKLYIWIDGNQDNPNTMMNQDFVFTLNASATDEALRSALPDFILNSNAPLDNVNSTFVQNATPGIDFLQTSSDTNGKGLYIRSGTENDLNPIYYYRGAVDNNNVYFANNCWKIVRSTETGGLKMIYNGELTENNTCDGEDEYDKIDEEDDYKVISRPNYYSTLTMGESGYFSYQDGDSDPKYVGYTYDDNGVETDSDAKGNVDSWYGREILPNFDSYVEDTIYCNDKSEYSYNDFTASEQNYYQSLDSFNIIYGGIYRAIKAIPNLVCPNKSDSYTKSSSLGNGKLTYAAGLLTSDEAILAGYSGKMHSGVSVLYNYLYNGKEFYTMSPFAYDENGIYNNYHGRMVCIDNGGNLCYEALYSPNGDPLSDIRPVISLKPEYNSFTYGNGTTTNPYRFVETLSS